jgi:hypothetical protein
MMLRSGTVIEPGSRFQVFVRVGGASGSAQGHFHVLAGSRRAGHGSARSRHRQGSRGQHKLPPWVSVSEFSLFSGVPRVAEQGTSITVMWRGKPVFIRHRNAREISLAKEDDKADLRDPQQDAQRVQVRLLRLLYCVIFSLR